MASGGDSPALNVHLASLQPPASGLLEIMNDGWDFSIPAVLGLSSNQPRLTCKTLCAGLHPPRLSVALSSSSGPPPRPTFASKFRKHKNDFLDLIRPQLVLDQGPLLKAFPPRLTLACPGPFPIAPTLLAARQYRPIVFIDLVETTARSSYFHPPHFPPMHDWIPHLLLYATHPIAPTTARASPLAERYPRSIKHAQQEQETLKHRPQQFFFPCCPLRSVPVALRSTPKYRSSDHHRVAGLGTHALDAARPKSSPDTWATARRTPSPRIWHAPQRTFPALWRVGTFPLLYTAGLNGEGSYMSPTKSSLPVPVRAHSLAVHRVALLPSLSPLSLPMLSSSPIGGTNTVLLLPLAALALSMVRMLPARATLPSLLLELSSASSAAAADAEPEDGGGESGSPTGWWTASL
ncbi:hypothetical protein B0H14DRAFT_3892647 [Mycena olivaceomarginata]|nr:hypothetical protein B0H14DRAFT_3892647 [Mycena olivaceomarginata]